MLKTFNKIIKMLNLFRAQYVSRCSTFLQHTC